MSSTPVTPASTPDPFTGFKQAQREGWSHFGPLALFTVPPAARLVRFSGLRAGQRVLDVGCGTGVVAITASRLGAVATGADLTPELIEQAKHSAEISHADVDWHVADVESLPFADAEFDVVLSQFGHMFAPRPALAVSEMLRVLRPGGTIAFSTWPPDHFIGRMFALTARYAPPPPPGASPPPFWGDPQFVRTQLGDAVRDLKFDRDLMTVNTLSPEHMRYVVERTAGPVIKLVEACAESNPSRLEEFRREFDALAVEYLEMNVMRQSYLMSRAIKV